jgi:hypothetical protein
MRLSYFDISPLTVPVIVENLITFGTPLSLGITSLVGVANNWCIDFIFEKFYGIF